MARNGGRRSTTGWLYHPEFPKHWEKRSLHSLARWVNGLAFRNPQFSSDGRPVIKIAEIKNGISAQTKFTREVFDESVRVRPGDLLFSWSGQPESSIDAFWWRGPEGWLNQHVFRVTPIESVDMHFFYYLLRYLNPNFVELAKNKQTTGLGHVTKRDLAKIEVALPSLGEQRAITAILGTLDDKIELVRRMSDTLEVMALSLFKSWFIDFDPVRAKMAGRPPDLAPPLWSLFPDRFGDDGLPSGWEMSSVGEHVINFDARRIPLSRADRDRQRGPYPYYGAAGVMDHVAGYLFEGVYLLLGEDGSVTRSNGLAVTQYAWGQFWVNNHAHVLQGKAPVSTEQAYLHFAFEPVAPYVTGAVQPKLSQGRMRRVPFVFAGKEICETFASTVQQWFGRIRACAAEANTLGQLRDTLLPGLVSGELRVKDAEVVLRTVL